MKRKAFAEGFFPVRRSIHLDPRRHGACLRLGRVAGAERAGQIRRRSTAKEAHKADEDKPLLIPSSLPVTGYLVKKDRVASTARNAVHESPKVNDASSAPSAPLDASNSDSTAARAMLTSDVPVTSLPYATINTIYTELQGLGTAERITFTHIVQQSVPEFSLVEASEALRRALTVVLRGSLLALVSPLVDSFLAKIDKIDLNQISAADIQILYVPVFKAFRHGSRPETERYPTKHAVEEVMRVASHLFDVLDRIPTSSTKPLRIRDEILDVLLSPQNMSKEMREMILSRLEQYGQKINPRQILRLYRSAVDDEDQDVARGLLNVTTRALASSSELSTFGQRHIKTKDREAEPIDFEITDSKEPTLITSAVDTVLLARIEPRLQAKLEGMRPFLMEPTQSPNYDAEVQTHRHAWSIVIKHISGKHRITLAEMSDLRRDMPPSAVCGATVTPIMKRLVERGHLQEAWEMWEDLCLLQKNAFSSERRRYVDRVALAVATETCFRLHGLDAAVELVDLWAKRNVRKNNPKALGDDAKGPVSDVIEHTIQLDVVNLNVLFTACRHAKSPSVAFRLWKAARPRWCIHPDYASLNLLLDTARLLEVTGPKDDFPEDLQTRLRMLAHGFSFRRLVNPGDNRGDEDAYLADEAKFSAYDTDGFSRGPTGVLLDPPNYKWYHEYGIFRPWQRCRMIFRQTVLGNWPHLREVKSPLDLDKGPLSYLSQFFIQLRPTPASPTQRLLPEKTALYTHIMPSVETFHAYISTLGYFGKVPEIPLALAWMQELRLRPTWNTMCAALTFIAEVEGPRRAVRGWSDSEQVRLARDEEVLRRYLEEWLGDGWEDVKARASKPHVELPPPDGITEGRRKVVPSETDVRDYRSWVMSKGRKLMQ